MRDRLEFHEILCDILGSRNVYFQPPESIKMKYPCIIYERTRPYVSHADNMKYMNKQQYTVTVVDKNPEGLIADKLADIPYSGFNRRFITDNLVHDVYNIYF